MNKTKQNYAKCAQQGAKNATITISINKINNHVSTFCSVFFKLAINLPGCRRQVWNALPADYSGFVSALSFVKWQFRRGKKYV